MWRLRKSEYIRNSNFKFLAKIGCRNGEGSRGLKNSQMHLPVMLLMCRCVIVSVILSR